MLVVDFLLLPFHQFDLQEKKKNIFKNLDFISLEINLPARSALSISSGVDDLAIKKVVVEQPGLPIFFSFDHD
jgi:hypothetical protein